MQEVYKEDCMYYPAVANIVEKDRPLLKRPYMRNMKKSLAESKEVPPIKTLEEAENQIFEGIE